MLDNDRSSLTKGRKYETEQQEQKAFTRRLFATALTMALALALTACAGAPLHKVCAAEILTWIVATIALALRADSLAEDLDIAKGANVLLARGIGGRRG
jgi:hypothetical protein